MTAAGDSEKMAEANEKKPIDDIEMGNVDADDKVQFINGRATPEKDDEFVGLSKAELEKFAKDPYWIKVRLILLIAFWVGWIIMLGMAVAIIVLTPRCPPEPNLDWWQKSPVYHIIPQSFKDSDGDGIGDIKGIEEKLTYIHETVNASTIMLNSFFESDDFGVTDYQAMESTIGTMAAFKDFRISAHKKGMKVILDFDPNHTSKNHTWFVNSRKCKSGVTNDFCDFYVWHAGRNGGLPNDWKNFYNQPAWTLDQERGEYYYHYYLAEQPDLNLRSAAVKQKLQEVIEYWVGHKVDGFRVRDIEHLIEANVTTDRHPITTTEQCGHFDQKETTLQPETFSLLAEWRQLLGDLSKDTTSKVLVADVLDVNNSTLNFYKYNSEPVLHMVFVPLKIVGQNPMDIQKRVAQVQSTLAGNWYGWKMGDENHRRAIGNYPVSDECLCFSSALNLLLLTLDGTHRTYYGEEIGMRDGSVTWNQGRDKLGWEQSNYAKCSRDFERTPMQWSGVTNGGFSNSNTTWLPVSSGAALINVLDQVALGAGHTSVEIYGRTVVLSTVPSILWGQTKFCRPDEDVVSFVRDASGFNSVYVAVNLGPNPSLLHVVPDCGLKDTVTRGFVIGNTGNVEESELGVGKELSLTHPILLKPRQGIVLEWSWKTSS